MMKQLLVLSIAILALACGSAPSEPDPWADSLELSVWWDYTDLHLEWTRYPGTYTLERRALPDGSYAALYAGTDTIYIDTTTELFVIYRYRISAFDEAQGLLTTDSIEVQRCFGGE